MIPIQKAFFAALPLSIAAISLVSTPAWAQFSLGIGVGVGGIGWHHHHDGGVFFGISPTIVIPSASQPAYQPPQPTCKALPLKQGEPPFDSETKPVLVKAHWEYLPDGQERWVFDHYECRKD